MRIIFIRLSFFFPFVSFHFIAGHTCSPEIGHIFSRLALFLSNPAGFICLDAERCRIQFPKVPKEAEFSPHAPEEKNAANKTQRYNHWLGLWPAVLAKQNYHSADGGQFSGTTK